MGEKVLGFETGGSTFLSGIIERGSREIRSINKKKIDQGSKEEYIQDVLENLEKTLDNSEEDIEDIDAIGVVSAGKWDFEKGEVTPPNLPFEKDSIPLGRKIKEKFNKPVYVENDVNAGVLAEVLFGHGKETDSRYIGYLTISSGIGLGLYDREKEEIFSGETGQAPEIGHNVVKRNGFECGCGGRGHWETYGSGNGVVNLAEKKIGKKFSAKEIYDAAERGEKQFVEVIEKSAYYNAVGVGQIINSYQPGTIVFGGTPVLKSTEVVFGKIKELLENPPRKNEFTYVYQENMPELRVTELGENNILLGSGAIALKKLEKCRLKI